jgi:hypothetical protein
MKTHILNGDYRHLFPIGKMYKATAKPWFYNNRDTVAEQRSNEIFMLIETSLYYYNHGYQTDAKVLMENGDLMILYAVEPDTISLVEVC